MGFKIAQDVPQVLLDLFNKVDFPAVNPEEKQIALDQIEKLTTKMIPLKTANTPKVQNPEPKKIAADFDQKLLDILNKIDWSTVDGARMTMGINFLKQFVSRLPQKKK